MRVSESLVESGGRFFFEKPKSEASRRTVRVPSFLVDALIAQREHPKVIQERLGRASIKTTLDTYGHLFEGLDEAATDRLEATYAAADVHTRGFRGHRPGRQMSKTPCRTRGFEGGPTWI